MSASLPTGIVTFLFTDIEGSIQLWEREPERMQAALAVHDRLLRQAIEGHGGQVLLSGVTAGVSLRPLGEHRLRDLLQPERVFQVVAAGLPADFPPLRVAAARVHLPQPPTGFVGRWEEGEAIIALLTAPGARLVSLVGPGGIGKTRLAIQAATMLAEREPERFADGVFFVPMAQLSSAAPMAGAIAEAIDFRFGPGERSPAEQLFDYLRRRAVLLIFDNMEQLLADGGASLPAELLAAAPGVCILATTRSRLGIRGEQLYPVPGMRLPDPAAVRLWADPRAEAEAYSALRLFAQATGRVQPGFSLQAGNVAAVTRICHQVQGMPLGIELAAGWLELLMLEEIAAEIDRSLDLLATDLRDVPARQRSLRAVFETTWQLSSERERALLPLLSFFRGPFSREAAAAVADYFSSAQAQMGSYSSYIDQIWSWSYVPDGLARARLGSGRLAAALESLREALSLVAASNLNELQPTVLTTLAEMALAAGRADGAATLGGLLANHPLTWNETRPRVAAVAAQARAALGDEAADAAEARGRSLDATALIARLAALPRDLAAWLDLIEE